MKLAATFENIFQYLFEAIGCIFSPSDDLYPAIGVQPFEGDPFSEWVDAQVG